MLVPLTEDIKVGLNLDLLSFIFLCFYGILVVIVCDDQERTI